MIDRRSGANPNIPIQTILAMLGFAPQPTSVEVFGKRLAQGFRERNFFAHQGMR
jgi:hypothetical protein